MEGKVVLIIQARMGSKRLPGKSMLDLAGEPLVGRILERVKRCEEVDKIVLTIPDQSSDNILSRLAKKYSITVSRGPENDLLRRYFRASIDNNADIVVRLPADNVTPEPYEIDKIIKFHKSRKERGFSTNLSEIFNSGYPDGIGAEVFDFSFFEDIFKKQPSLMQKEHIHLNFFNYNTKMPVDNEWCPVKTIICPEEYSRPELILDVNTLDQYLFMKSLYESLYPKNPFFSIKDIINWYDNVYMK